MRSIWRIRCRSLGTPVMIGAFALGLGGALPLHAQGPRGSAKTTSQPEVQKPRLPARGRDAHSSRARWRAQQIAARKAEAEYNNARLAREIAEIAVLEYEEGIVFQDIATVDGEIKLAESDRSRSQDRLAWVRRMLDKRFVAESVRVSEELSVKKAAFALEQAVSKKKVLIDYTKPKTIKELKTDVEEARSNELATKAAWELEKSIESALEHYVIRSQATSGTPESP